MRDQNYSTETKISATRFRYYQERIVTLESACPKQGFERSKNAWRARSRRMRGQIGTFFPALSRKKE